MCTRQFLLVFCLRKNRVAVKDNPPSREQRPIARVCHSGYGVVLLSARTQAPFPATAAASLMEAKTENARVFEISAI